MADAKRSETLLLTEHFNWTPLSLLDDIINTVNEIANTAVDGLESGLQGASPIDLGFKQKADAERKTIVKDDDGDPIFPDAAIEIEDGANKLQTLLDANIDRNFDKLEIYVLRSVLSVPHELLPWVKLAHYENLSLPIPSVTSDVATSESLQKLRRQYQETRKLHTALKARRSQNAAVLRQLPALMSPAPATLKAEPASPEHKSPTALSKAGAYAFLAHTPSAQALGVQAIKLSPSAVTGDATDPKPGPLETNTSFTLSQLPALRALLAELRPRLASLGGSSSSVTAVESTAERERKLYIEAQTRKVLERRGFAVDKVANEEIGRKVAPEERAALESIVMRLAPGGEGMEE